MAVTDKHAQKNQKPSNPCGAGVAKPRIAHLKDVTGRPVTRCRFHPRPYLLGVSPYKLLVLIALAAVWQLRSASAETIPVRQMEGSIHAFLVVQTLDGKRVAEGDVIETTKGATVKIQTSYHFHDGSFYEETSEFSQHGQFRLLSNRLVQKGPSFKMAMDRTIDASTGQVSVRYTDDKGKEKMESQRLELPADIANGLFSVLMKNIDPAITTTVTVVAGEPKPRLVKVIITPEGKSPFLIGRSKREGTEFDLKAKIEGAAGVVAPLVGKQPPDTHIWVFGGIAPVVLKSEGPLEPDGPIWRVQNVGPAWPSDTPQKESRK
jgi:hypothetical protein